MRKESWPSISSRSAVSYSTPAMALLSMKRCAKRLSRIVALRRGVKNKTQPWGWVPFSHAKTSEFGDVAGLRTFLALHDLKLDLVTFLQALVALGSNGAVVNKNIRAVVTTDEPEALGVVKPFNCSFDT